MDQEIANSILKLETQNKALSALVDTQRLQIEALARDIQHLVTGSNAHAQAISKIMEGGALLIGENQTNRTTLYSVTTIASAVAHAFQDDAKFREAMLLVNESTVARELSTNLADDVIDQRAAYLKGLIPPQLAELLRL
jgi:hypothetical protein